MSIVEPDAAAPRALVERVKAILLKPAQEWGVIDLEPATVKGLYTGYACILAAIPAVCGLVGGQLFGFGVLGVTFHPSLVGALSGAIVQYVLSLAMVFVLALVIDALAPSFDGQKNQIQALKVAIYASTASWVAGVFTLIPPLGALAILGGLYGLYLLYLGLPKLMKAPEAKALGYTVTTIVVAVVLSVIVGAVVGGVGRLGMLGGGLATGSGAAGGTLTGAVGLPGGGSIDLGKLQQASKQMEAAAKQAQTGATADGQAIKPVEGAALQTLLPPSLAGYITGDVSNQTSGVAGLAGSSAEARYTKGDANISLQVSDLGGAAGLAALGGAFNIKASKQTSTGYERVGKVDGRMTTEEWNSQSKNGKFGVMVADRFMVQAEGSGVSMDELKGAVRAIDFGKLEGLAHS